MPTQLEQMITELNTTLNQIYEKLSLCYKYMPYIYPQLNYPNESTGLFVIDYNGSSIPSNSFLYMLPKLSSITENGSNTNRLKVILSRDSNGAITLAKTYRIKMEDESGNLVNLPKNAIASGRVATFRFMSGDDNICILTNHPMYDSVTVKNLTVTERTIFNQVPYYTSETVTNPTILTADNQLALFSFCNNLLQRIVALENKFVIGTENIEDVVDDLPEGSIYIQTELGESDD